MVKVSLFPNSPWGKNTESFQRNKILANVYKWYVASYMLALLLIVVAFTSLVLMSNIFISDWKNIYEQNEWL